MTKVVINRACGGYELLPEHYDYLGINWDGYGTHMEDDRANPVLVRCVECVGTLEGRCTLRVIEIPDDVTWKILDYDGMEVVVDANRIWGEDD